jgi:hypothetical protein
MKENTDNHPLTEHRPTFKLKKRREEFALRRPKLDMTITSPGEKHGAVVTAEDVEIQVTTMIMDHLNSDTGKVWRSDVTGGTCRIKADSIILTAAAQNLLPDVKFMQPNLCNIEFELDGHKLTMSRAVIFHTSVVGGDEDTGNFRLFGVELTGEIEGIK